MADNRTPILKDFPSYGPLQGIRIIDSGSYSAGPFGATLAGDYGAEVIKLEQPQGDSLRYLSPQIEGENGEAISTCAMGDFRNKLGLTLNLKTDEGKEVFKRLLEESDIWIESSVPGSYPKMGITDEWVWSINPKMVIVHVSGYGQTGPLSGRPSYDIIGQAYSGLCDLNGEKDGDPLRVGPAINDYGTGVWTYLSALTAYVYAQRTGIGQSVDLAQYEAQYRTLDQCVPDYLNLGIKATRNGNWHACGLQPFGIYPTSDGYVAVSVGGGKALEGLKEVLPELSDINNLADQVKNAQRIKDVLENYLEDKTVSEVDENFFKHNIPCCPVMDLSRIAEDEHYQARDMIIEWDSNVGKVKGEGIVPKFSKTPGQVWRGAPSLGQDTKDILGYLGYDGESIGAMQEAGVIK